MALTKVTYNMIEGAAVNVLDFGADPTGATDSLAAIQAAVDYAAPYAEFATDGIQVYLPPGVYEVSNSINLSQRPGVHLVGAGQKATEIAATSNNPVIKYTGSSTNVTNASGIRSMTIRGFDNAQTNSYGIYSSWTNSCNIQDLIIFGCYAGLYFEHVWQTNVSNVHMYGGGADRCTYGVYMAASTVTNIDNAIIAYNVNVQNCLHTGFRIINGQGSKFTACEAGGNPMLHGWYIGNPPSGTVECKWIHFNGCLGDSTSQAAWLLRKGTAIELSEMQFSNCWAGNGDHGWFVEGAKNIAMSGCMAIGNTQSGITLYNSDEMMLTGWVFRGNNEGASATMADIMLQGAKYATITGCSCNNNFAGKSLIEKDSANSNNIYGNNLFQGATIIGNLTQVFRNRAFKTEARGQSDIDAAATSVTVTHGIQVTFPASAINVTPKTGLGTASFFWVENVTATTFDIIVDSAPGVDIGFWWNISLSTLQG